MSVTEEEEEGKKREMEIIMNSRKTSSSPRMICFMTFLSLWMICLMNGAVSCNSSHSNDNKCNGSIAECNEELEILMDSEVSRRFLEQKKYISAGALKRDQPVCNGGSNGGQPYSRSEGCLPPQSNPYQRGCSTYYRCRHDS